MRTLNRYPVVIFDDGTVDDESVVGTIKMHLKNRVSDFSRYRVKYELSNVKFSTKCNWTKSR